MIRPNPARSCVLCALVLAAMAFIPAPAARANVNFVESIDLPGSVSGAANLGTVGAGLNTVQGTLAAARVANALLPLGGDSFDAFAFTVPPGMVVTRIRVEFSNWSTMSGSGGSFAAYVDAGNSTGEAQYQTVSGNASLANIVSTSEGVLNPGTYTLWTHAGDNVPGPQRQIGDTLSCTYLYTITAVPLIEYIETTDASPLGVPLGTLGSPVGAASDGGYLRISGTTSGSAVPLGGGAGWRGDTDAFTFTIPAGTAGTRLLFSITSFTPVGTFTTLPAGSLQLTSSTTGESYTKVVSGVGSAADLVPASAGGALSAGVWTATFQCAAGTPVSLGQSATAAYAFHVLASTDAVACCNRWTGSCVVTTSSTCGGLGLNLLGFGSTCSPAACRACPADFDGSGTLAVADIFAMLNAWFAGCP
jgi:hypothetical protein